MGLFKAYTDSEMHQASHDMIVDIVASIPPGLLREEVMCHENEERVAAVLALIIPVVLMRFEASVKTGMWDEALREITSQVLGDDFREGAAVDVLTSVQIFSIVACFLREQNHLMELVNKLATVDSENINTMIQ